MLTAISREHSGFRTPGPSGGGPPDAPDSDDSTADPPAAPSSAPSDSNPPNELPLDVVCSVLSNSRRRLILERLSEEGDSTLSALAGHVAAVENDKVASELTSKERKRVYISLYQNHLPRMEDLGVVTTGEDGAVTLGPNASDVFEFLETSEGASRWPAYYGAATGLGAAALVAGTVLAESLLPLLFGLTLLGYTVLVCAHAWTVTD